MYTDIIVGAGSAGCVLAERLSRTGRRVLVIEAGEHYRSRDTPSEIASPNNFPALADGRFLWPLDAVLTATQPPKPFQQGRGVGGSSAINNTWAIRARPADLDRWARAGCTRIEWTQLSNHYRATEKDLDFGYRSHHGDGGPLQISRLDESSWSPVDRAFRDVAVSRGISWTEDLNDPDAVGVGPIPMTIAGNRRVSANDAFLDPAADRPTVEVRSRTFVERIAFDGNRAVGVTVVESGIERIIRGENVFLCAGAVQSPLLLMRSGIGPSGDLRQAGVEPWHHLDGIGRNLVEHPMVIVLFELAETAQSPDVDVRQGNCLARPHGSADGDRWHLGCLGVSPLGTGFGGGFASLMHPNSRGRVDLAEDGRPLVTIDALSTEDDVNDLWTGFELLVDWLSSPHMKRVIAGPLLTETGPLDMEAIRIDRAEWLRATCFPYRHLAGTCRMSDTPETGVVDGSHRVWGTKNLYVVDASVLPDATSSNLNLTVIALASRAAEVILG